jgi:hypothetical protein
MSRRRSASWLLLLALLAGGAAVAFAARSKPRSISALDAVFQATAPGTIEASLNPPIEGVLRIVVRAGTSRGRPRTYGSAGSRPSQSADRAFSLEVSQSDRPIPFRLVGQSDRHKPARGARSLFVADIDVNDLTPGLPVRVRIHSTLANPPDLEGSAFQVVY